MKMKKIIIPAIAVFFLYPNLSYAQNSGGQQIPPENVNNQNQQQTREMQTQSENQQKYKILHDQACNELSQMYNRMMSVNILSQGDSGINGTLVRHQSLQRYLTLLISLQCNLQPIIDVEKTRLSDVEQRAIQMQNTLNSQKQ